MTHEEREFYSEIEEISGMVDRVYSEVIDARRFLEENYVLLFIASKLRKIEYELVDLSEACYVLLGRFSEIENG